MQQTIEKQSTIQASLVRDTFQGRTSTSLVIAEGCREVLTGSLSDIPGLRCPLKDRCEKLVSQCMFSAKVK